MKKILAILVIVCIAIGMTACRQSGSKSSVKPIKIGLTTVLTGDRSIEGEYASNGAKIIQQEINDAGGVLGRPIEIVIQDALGTDVGAVNAFRKLADDKEMVVVIGSDSSNDNIAISSAVLEYTIPTIAQGSSPTLRDICNNDNKWLFQIRACDETLCASLINYAVQKTGYKKFVVIHDTETSSADQARLFTQALAKNNIKPVINIPFTTGTKDFTSHIAQIQKAGADAIIGACFQAEAAILITQVRSIMKDIPIFGSNAFADPVTIRLAGKSVNGVFCASAWVPTTPNPKGAALAKKYKELYKEDCGKSAAQVYDAVSVICEAIKRAGTTDHAAVRDAFNTIDNFQGAITNYDCRTNGDCGRGGLLVKVENEVAVVLEQITSEKVIKK